MSKELQRIALYLAIALSSSFIFQAFAPRKVQTSKQTKAAIEANKQESEELKAQQERIEEQQERIERCLLEVHNRQNIMLQNQRAVLSGLNIPDGIERSVVKP